MRWDDILEEGVRAAAVAVDADAAMVLARRDGLDHVLAHVGLPHALEISRAVDTHLGLMRFLTPAGVFVEDVEHHPLSRMEFLDLLPMRAVLGMPLGGDRTGPVGGLFMCARVPRTLKASAATMTPLLERLGRRLGEVLNEADLGAPTVPHLRVVQAMQIGDVDATQALQALRALPPVSA